MLADLLGPSYLNLQGNPLPDENIGVCNCLVLECPVKDYFEEIDELAHYQLAGSVIAIDSLICLLSYTGTLISMKQIFLAGSKSTCYQISAQTQIVVVPQAIPCSHSIQCTVHRSGIGYSRTAWPDLESFMKQLSENLENHAVIGLSNYHHKLSIASENKNPLNKVTNVEDDVLNLMCLLEGSTGQVWNVGLYDSLTILEENYNGRQALVNISLANSSIRFSKSSPSAVLTRYLMRAIIMSQFIPITIYLSSSITNIFNNSGEPLSEQMNELYVVLAKFLASKVLTSHPLSLVLSGHCSRFDDFTDIKLVFPRLDSSCILSLLRCWLEYELSDLTDDDFYSITESLTDNLSFRQLQALYHRCRFEVGYRGGSVSFSLVKSVREKCMFPCDQIDSSANLILPTNIHKTDCNVQRNLPGLNDLMGFGSIKSLLNSILFNSTLATPEPIPFCSQMKSLLNCPHTALLLYGPPGSGKTSLARSLSRECDSEGKSIFNFLEVSIPNLVRSGVGDTEKELDSIFSQSIALAPSIVFIDEISCVFGLSDQGDGASGLFSRQISAQLKQCLDEIYSWNQRMSVIDAGRSRPRYVFVVATTNEPWKLDAGLVRLGRFDVLCHIGQPDDNERSQIVKRLLHESTDCILFDIDDVAIGELSKSCFGLTMADLVYIFKNMLPIERRKAEGGLQLDAVVELVQSIRERRVASELRSKFDVWRQAQHSAVVNVF